LISRMKSMYIVFLYRIIAGDNNGIFCITFHRGGGTKPDSVICDRVVERARNLMCRPEGVFYLLVEHDFRVTRTWGEAEELGWSATPFSIMSSCDHDGDTRF
jgi:hypothetical protein